MAQTITLRLTIPDPVPGVMYSLQDKDAAAVGAIVATAAGFSFDVPIKLSDDLRLTGPFVRSESGGRRFVYLAIGRQAGDVATELSRRAKIDIHDIPLDLLAQAKSGRILEAVLPGRDKHGQPACATLRPLGGWRAL